MTTHRTGRCLCDAVSYTASIEQPHTGACHCQMCRRWSGGPFMAIDAGTSVVWEGEDNIATYRSSEWAERGFCKTCGSNLFYRLVQSGEVYLATGTLDDQDGIAFTSQVFIDEKPDFYSFAQQTRTMTGPEIFALYGATPED